MSGFEAAQQVLAALKRAEGLFSENASASIPAAHVEPKPLPPAAGTVCCYIGTADGDLSVCPENTDTYTYFDKDGNYVAKSASSGEVTIMHPPGPLALDPTGCFLPSAGADRAICGPGTTSWTYPQDGYLITEVLLPNGRPRFGTERHAVR